MVHHDYLKISVDDYGSFLGRGEGCFEVRHKDKRIESYPHFEREIGEATLLSGSSVSVDALIDLALWNIDTYIMNRRNRVIAVLKNLEDDSHVKTRLGQYRASIDDRKSAYIAEQIILAKIEGQNRVLEKHGLKKLNYAPRFTDADNSKMIRQRFNGIEGRYASNYYHQIFSLFPEKLRPETRRTYKAYDGLNNVFNFGYYVLKCRVHKALLKAKLEPYLGFLHSIQFGKPSLVCDIQELYRYLIDDFLIERCQKLHKNDFVLTNDFIMRLKMGKRIHLCEHETSDLAEGLNELLQHTVDVPRIKNGNKQRVETLINEECLLLARYLRNEKKEWHPRIPELTS
jgi:CRISPR-associated protein Cas1